MRAIFYNLLILVTMGVFGSMCDVASDTKSESNSGTFEVTLSGAINSQFKGEASFLIMNCASLNFRSAEEQLSFNDFCSTTQDGIKEGRFPIEAVSPISSGKESFVGFYDPCKEECKKSSYRGVEGELIISEIKNNVAKGRFLFKAKPLDDDGNVIEDTETVQFEGTFSAEGVEAKD